MTDWWNTGPVRQGDDSRQEWQARANADMERIARSGEDLSGEPDDWGYDPDGSAVDTRQSRQDTAPDLKGQKPDRRKALILGAAGAAVAGVLVFSVMPDDSAGTPTGPVGPSATSQGDFLPAAGDGPSEGVQGSSTKSSASTPESVTLTASAAGSGSVGAIVELAIRNGTDEAVVVMSSMVKGDGRPAVIGEGTLAPGSRRIEPGETATGTVEFASKKAPAQILLMDLGGNVVASSG